MALNDDIYSKSLRRRALVTMYERQLAKELDDLLVLHRDQIRAIILSGNLSDIRKIEQRYIEQSRKTYRTIYSTSIKELNSLYGSEGKFQLSTINNSLRNIYNAKTVGLSGNRVKDLLIENRRTLLNHYTSISMAERTKVMSLIRLGLAEKLNNRQIAAMVAREAIRLPRAQVDTIVRTSVTQITNDVTKDIYNNNKDVLKGYQYVATLDSRTSIICGRLDGKVYSLDSNSAPQPPQHFGCRSTTIPIVKSADQLMLTNDRRIRKTKLKNITNRRRASINGAVPARTTYADWLMSQPNEVKLQLLGSQRRVTIFNRGELKLTQFSNRMGRLTSLKRLDELSNI